MFQCFYIFTSWAVTLKKYLKIGLYPPTCSLTYLLCNLEWQCIFDQHRTYASRSIAERYEVQYGIEMGPLCSRKTLITMWHHTREAFTIEKDSAVFRWKELKVMFHKEVNRLVPIERNFWTKWYSECRILSDNHSQWSVTARDSIAQPSVCHLIICISNVLQNVYQRNLSRKMLA
jgi:hypothetical protein